MDSKNLKKTKNKQTKNTHTKDVKCDTKTIKL